jgi:hypothetical protein
MASSFGFGNTLRQQIHPNNIFRPGSPSDELVKPITFAATDFKDAFRVK